MTTLTRLLSLMGLRPRVQEPFPVIKLKEPVWHLKPGDSRYFNSRLPYTDRPTVFINFGLTITLMVVGVVASSSSLYLVLRPDRDPNLPDPTRISLVMAMFLVLSLVGLATAIWDGRQHRRRFARFYQNAQLDPRWQMLQRAQTGAKDWNTLFRPMAQSLELRRMARARDIYLHDDLTACHDYHRTLESLIAWLQCDLVIQPFSWHADETSRIDPDKVHVPGEAIVSNDMSRLLQRLAAFEAAATELHRIVKDRNFTV